MNRPTSPAAALLLAASLTPCALEAQWVTFSNQTATRSNATSSLFAADQQEKDYAWGDLDQDGDIDLVIVRKQPYTSPGRFPNVLLMNEGGVLTDRSSTLTGSLLAPSQGFLDDTNDRDVVIADVTGDGWDDVVTCTTLSAGLAQYLRVPRVYVNQGLDSSGQWLGLLYDDALRIDDSGWGNQGEHRFCSVAAGDVDGDGDLDLYFGDYQQGGGRSVDIDDRLLINDGTGYFTDETTTRMTYQMVESSFGMKVAIVDMNADGKPDIVKDDALNAPQGISISFNDGPNPGYFGSYQVAYGNTPYHFNIGDLNNDNLPDMIVSDDGQDRYILNQLASPGQAPVPFSPTKAFTYSGGGSDDGFGGNNLIVDLDHDGWNDAIIADVDVDISGCNRRCHIFRNLGDAPNVTLQEQISNGQVVGGITPNDLKGTFDVAVFDIDGDGYHDMVVGRCTGTEIYIQTPPQNLTITPVGGVPQFLPPQTAVPFVVDAIGTGGVAAVSGSGVLHYEVNGGGFTSAPMSDNGAGRFTGTLPLTNCADSVRFYVSIDINNGQTLTEPAGGAAEAHEALGGYGTVTIVDQGFETGAAGWTVVDDPALAAGTWERAVPNGTITLGQIAAPYVDADSSGQYCFVTEQGPVGGTAAANDIDGGYTDLISPPIDLADGDGTVSFYAWLFSSLAGSDPLEVSVTADGSTWVPALTISPSYGNAPNHTNQWRRYSFRVGSLVTPSANVQVRFRAQDTGTGQVVEAGLDRFQVERLDCTYCQPVFSLQTVGPAVLSMCGEVLIPGATTTLEVAPMPPGSSGLLVFDVFPAPSPFHGGELITASPIVLGPTFANANGSFSVPLPIGGLLPSGWALYLQAIYVDASQPQGIGITNALHVQWQ